MTIKEIIEFVKSEPVTGNMFVGLPNEEARQKMLGPLEQVAAILGDDFDVPVTATSDYAIADALIAADGNADRRTETRYEVLARSVQASAYRYA